MNADDQNHRTILESIAHRIMLERDLLPDFSAEALAELGKLQIPIDSIVTVAYEKRAWVRLLTMPVEGKVVQGFEGMDVGDRMRVQLINTNVERGYIDFKKVISSRKGGKTWVRY